MVKDGGNIQYLSDFVNYQSRFLANNPMAARRVGRFSRGMQGIRKAPIHFQDRSITATDTPTYLLTAAIW